MAMKETEGSLKAYFLIAGVIAMLASVRDIDTASKIGGGLPASWMVAIWFPTIARLVLGAGFVLAGVRLKAALPSGATWIKQLLLAALVVMVADAMIVAAVLGTTLGQREMISSFIGLAITAYLIASVRRLAAEAVARNQVPPARVA